MWKCKKCGEEIEDFFDSCWQCGTPVATAADNPRPPLVPNVSKFQISPKEVPPPRCSDSSSNYSDQQEAERRTGSVKYNLGCLAAGVLVVLFCMLITGADRTNGPLASIILLVSLFALPFISNMVIRKAAVQDNVRSIISERSDALQEADQRREDSATLDIAGRLGTLYDAQESNVASLPDILAQGGAAVDSAQELFNERAYTPFWDSIEQAVGELKRFNDRVRLIDASAKQYYGLLEGRDHTFPPFPVKVEHIPTPDGLVQRLSQVIGRAHRDFQFASIYEQRKTTGAVVAGFRSMQEAVTRLRDDIVDSIGDLQESLGTGLREIGSAIQTSGERQGEAMARLQQTLDVHSAAVQQKEKQDAKHKEFVKEALDNIQHRRKPRP